MIKERIIDEQRQTFSDQITLQNKLIADIFPEYKEIIGSIFPDRILIDPEFQKNGIVSEERLKELFPVRYEIYRSLQAHLDGMQTVDEQNFILIVQALSKLNSLKNFVELEKTRALEREVEDIRSIKQADIYSSLLENFEQGYIHGRIEAPTGSGKTIVFLNTIIYGAFLNGIILVPTKKLAEQTEVSAINKFNRERKQNISIGVISKARKEFDAKLRIVINPSFVIDSDSVNPKIRAENTSIVIIDESHHAVTEPRVYALSKLNPYIGLSQLELQQIQEYTDPVLRAKRFISAIDSIVITFTATGYKTEEVFGPLIHKIHLREAIIDGMLAGVQVSLAIVDYDLTEFTLGHGDFTNEQIEKIIRDNRIYDSVLEVYKRQFYKDSEHFKQAIVFWNTQEQANIAAETFREQNIYSLSTHSGKEDAEEKDIDEQFRSGTLPVLHNVRTLAEGYDYSEVSVCLIPLPTTSPTKLEQEIGRVLRLKKDSSNADVVCWIYHDMKGRQITPIDIFEGAVITRDSVNKKDLAPGIEYNPEFKPTLSDLSNITLLTSVDEVLRFIQDRKAQLQEKEGYIPKTRLALELGHSENYFITSTGLQLIKEAESLIFIEQDNYISKPLRDSEGRFLISLAQKIRELDSFISLSDLAVSLKHSPRYFEKPRSKRLVQEAVNLIKSKSDYNPNDVLINSVGKLSMELAQKIRELDSFISQSQLASELGHGKNYFLLNSGKSLIEEAEALIREDGESNPSKTLRDSEGKFSIELAQKIRELDSFISLSDLAEELGYETGYFKTSNFAAQKLIEEAIELIKISPDYDPNAALINSLGKISKILASKIKELNSFINQKEVAEQLGYYDTFFSTKAGKELLEKAEKIFKTEYKNDPSKISRNSSGKLSLEFQNIIRGLKIELPKNFRLLRNLASELGFSQEYFTSGKALDIFKKTWKEFIDNGNNPEKHYIEFKGGKYYSIEFINLLRSKFIES